jgi:hypothetical protein
VILHLVKKIIRIIKHLGGGGEDIRGTTKQPQYEYLTLRLVSSLNNPQNNEMKFCEK